MRLEETGHPRATRQVPAEAAQAVQAEPKGLFLLSQDKRRRIPELVNVPFAIRNCIKRQTCQILGIHVEFPAHQDGGSQPMEITGSWRSPQVRGFFSLSGALCLVTLLLWVRVRAAGSGAPPGCFQKFLKIEFTWICDTLDMAHLWDSVWIGPVYICFELQIFWC